MKELENMVSLRVSIMKEELSKIFKKYTNAKLNKKTISAEKYKKKLEKIEEEIKKIEKAPVTRLEITMNMLSKKIDNQSRITNKKMDDLKYLIMTNEVNRRNESAARANHQDHSSRGDLARFFPFLILKESIEISTETTNAQQQQQQQDAQQQQQDAQQQQQDAQQQQQDAQQQQQDAQQQQQVLMEDENEEDIVEEPMSEENEEELVEEPMSEEEQINENTEEEVPTSKLSIITCPGFPDSKNELDHMDRKDIKRLIDNLGITIHESYLTTHGSIKKDQMDHIRSKLLWIFTQPLVPWHIPSREVRHSL